MIDPDSVPSVNQIPDALVDEDDLVPDGNDDSAPRKLPIGVRAADRITTSLMLRSPLPCSRQRLFGCGPVVGRTPE